MADNQPAIATFREALDLAGLKPATKSAYLAVARRFIAAAGRPPARGYPRAAFTRYFAPMAAAGASPAKLHFEYAALRRLMRALELPPPTLERRDLPRKRRSTVDTWVEGADVERMIRAVLTDSSFGEAERCVVALATVYGLRASELLRCGIDADGKHIVVGVAKSDDTARQLIPDEIRPYIMCAPVGHEAYWIKTLYHRLERAAGVKKPRGSRSGFHHIRRALNTGLVRAGVPMPLIQRFMRWHPPGFFGPLHYLRGDTDAMDREVFGLHPFLRLWRESAQAPAPAAAPAETPTVGHRKGRGGETPRSRGLGRAGQKRRKTA